MDTHFEGEPETTESVNTHQKYMVPQETKEERRQCNGESHVNQRHHEISNGSNKYVLSVQCQAISVHTEKNHEK